MTDSTTTTTSEVEDKPKTESTKRSKEEILLIKKKQIDAQLQLIKNRENAKTRKAENRKKILIGSAILKSIKDGQYSDEKLKSLMDKFLTKKTDRELFNLSEKTANE